MAQQKIRIRLKGYDHTQLDRSAQSIVETAQRTGATITGPVPLPTERNVYCVIRSPFKDKDSREHFEVRTHKRLIDIHSPTPKTVDSLMRLDLPAGVDIEIKLGERHRRQEAGDDPALRSGERRRHARYRDRGRALPDRPGEDRGHGRVRGYQLAFEPVAERKVTKGELGHLKKAQLDAHRHLVEFRGVTEIPVGEAVTVEAFEPGEKVKVSGISIGKGFAGHDQAPQLPPWPGVARIAQRPRSRLDRCLGDPLARVQGPEDGGPHGR